MVVLDIAIVNVALPSIQKDLGIGQSSSQWIVLAHGLMLGGFLLLRGRMADLLRRRPGWRRVFLIHVPVGVLFIATAAISLPVDVRDGRGSEGFEIAGAVTVTGGLVLPVYAVNRATDFGWGSASTLGLFAASVAMLFSFVPIDAPTGSPAPARLVGAQPHGRGGELSAVFTFGAFFSAA